MSRKPITRRAFLKSAGASAAGIAAMRLFGSGVLASGEASAPPPDGGAAQGGGQFVYRPYWGDKNVKTALGGEILFFGDIHDLEDDYFYYDAATGETRGVFTYLKNGDKKPGLYASIGDYLQQSSDISQNADAFTKSIDRLRAWAGEDAVIVSVMGNHEFKTAGSGGLNGEQVVEKAYGNNNYGLVARGVDPEDREKTLYFVVAFGCAHTQEIDEANTRANATNKYWVNPDQIAALDETLASIYGADGTKNQGIPTFIDAHLPVHYYTWERCAENNCDLLTVLNKYPWVVYVWGHNHSEKDPYYGTVKLPGNTIVPNAGLEEKNADGAPAAREITFTYVACGAVRGNQISDDPLENSERALYVTVDGSRLRFEYCGRDGEVFDRTAYTDIREMTHFEDFRTLGARSAAGLTADLAEETDPGVVRRCDLFLARPIAGETPSEVISFSERYQASVRWLDGSGDPVTDSFSCGETYAARIELSSEAASFRLTEDDVYLFDLTAKAIPVDYITEKRVSVSDHGAVVDVVFAQTAVLAEEPLVAASGLVEGRRYIIASDREQYLFTQSRKDCVTEGDRLLTVPNYDRYWTVEKLDDGYALRSASGQYLTAAMNGMNAVFTPVRELSEGLYTKWMFTDDALTIDMDGTIRCFAYSGGSFVLAANGTGAACRLYEIPERRE